ncbi:MAG: DUF3494 domain-containing protein [Bacillus sp. (in: Bacteria)]|nr:DUF3494 domain-containing protein [Bacillus sp. (in: firmicutes)]
MKAKYLKLIPILLLSSTLVFSNFAIPASAAVTAPNLGSASNFGLLANTMTTVGTTIHGGDAGAISQTVVPATPDGLNHINDAAYTAANIDLGKAIAFANSQEATFTGLPGEDLGGNTLQPGVYHYPGDVSIGSETLTLSGNNVFIFQIDGTLNTAANTKILLADGAQACNVFWVVKGATTLAANTEFIGTIMSQSAAVTVGITTTINGRILSQNAVTFTNPGPSDITVPNCGPIPEEPITEEPTTEEPTPIEPTPIEPTPVEPIPDESTPVSTPAPTSTTESSSTGHQLPNTASPLYNFILIGSVLTIMGTVLWRRKLRE